MYRFGQTSETNLLTCDKRIQFVLREAIKIIDFSVICGHRDKHNQNRAFNSGSSKLPFPKSKHNKMPSLAVDITPFPLDWDNLERFYFLAGIVLGIGHSNDIKLRYGGDWDRDGDITDNNFNDLVHFELI